MNIEESRLQTFTNWPADAVVTPSRIAKAGFYSLNQNLTVECFSCGLQISEWNYGDQVMARHRQLSPTCAFVVDPSTSGNVPSISQSTSRTDNIISPTEDAVDSPLNSQSLKHEAVRLQSFDNWPVSHIVTPESLARAGFYYLKQRDKTKCAFCDGIVVAWEVGDDPDREHRRHFPDCSFVQTVINPRLEHLLMEGLEDGSNITRNPPLSNLNIISQDNLNELGIITHRGPKRSKYATVESRMRTFASWPADLIQTPDALSQAGFYYEGCGDQVRCFHCDGGLRHWDPQDDPWTEHARWFPTCAFVQLVKGSEFIAACAIETEVGTEAVDEETRRCSRTIVRRVVTEREIQTYMLTPQVITALNIGLHVGRIKQALKDKLERTGTGFSTADAVIEATLNLQHNEEESIDSHISDQVTRLLSNAIQQSLNSNQHTSPTNNDRPVTSSQPRPPSQPVEENNPTSDSEPKGGKVLTLEEENRLLKEERLCKICMDVEVGIVFLPCGHLATCVNCAPNLQDCPLCRSAIKAIARTYFS